MIMTYDKGQVHQHGDQDDEDTNGSSRGAKGKKERNDKRAADKGYHSHNAPIKLTGKAPDAFFYLLQRVIHRKLVAFWLSLPNRHQVVKFFHSGCTIQLIFVLCDVSSPSGSLPICPKYQLFRGMALHPAPWL